MAKFFLLLLGLFLAINKSKEIGIQNDTGSGLSLSGSGSGIGLMPDVTTQPDIEPTAEPGIEDYIVIIVLEGLSLESFSEEMEDVFKQLTAEAVNSYRRQQMTITKNNIFVTNLNIDSEGQVTFYVYLQNQNGFLSGAMLLEAINVFDEEYDSRGFSVSASLFVPPTIPPSMIPTLTVQQIIIIAVVVSVAVVIIAVIVVVIVIVCYTVSTKKSGKLLVDEERKKLTVKSNKIQPMDITTTSQ